MNRKGLCISRERLEHAVSNIYDEAAVWAGIALNDSDSFFDGLQPHRSVRYTKEQLLSIIAESPLEEFPRMPELGYLVLSRHLFVCKDYINRAQIMLPTPDVEGFIHAADTSMPWYDVYYLIDHEKKTITFALGNKRSVLSLHENSGWAWKLAGTELLCTSTEKLAENFQEKFWNPIAVILGRKALRIKNVI